MYSIMNWYFSASVMALICAILLPSMKQGVYAKDSKSHPESGITGNLQFNSSEFLDLKL